MRTNSDTLTQGPLGEWRAGEAEWRSAARASANVRWLGSIGILMPFLALLWFTAAVSGKLLTMLAVAGVIMAGVWGYQPIAEANRSAVLGGHGAIAERLGLAYQADPEAGPEFAAARTYGLVPAFDHAAIGHGWFGQFDGHDVRLYDAHLEASRGSGKGMHWDTVFRGAIIRIGFGRDFAATTLLQRAGAHRTWLGLGASRDSINPDGHRLDRVDQVDPDFAQAFSVFSDDPAAARAMVQPAYVERLLELESALGAQELRALFARGAVIIAVEGGSLGEVEDRKAFAALAGLAEAINRAEREKAAQDARQSAPER